MKVLAIGAHFDDLELGCGGSLLRWKAEGHDVTGLILTDSGYKDETGREIRSSAAAQQEGRKAAEIAGYKLIEGKFKTFGLESTSDLNSYILSVINSARPDLLLTHWHGDTHIDHSIIAQSSLHCSRRIGRVLMYRSNWYVGETAYKPTFFVDITTTFPQKMELVKIFESELSRTSNQWFTWLDAQAREYGLMSGHELAEAFETIKWTW